MMKIVADENIPRVKDVFGHFGEVTTLPGRKIRREQLKGAEVLLVRSVTPVDARLLSGSEVRFVGTATIGTDHLDKEYLRDRGIRFASAPGSNANSVAEYVTAALLALACRKGTGLNGRSIGVIGVGNVGGKVVEKVSELGMQVVKNDPPLRRHTADPTLKPLEQALRCDYVTLHVPLEKEGADPTYRMVEEAFLGAMRRDAVLINTSRGEVVHENALKRALARDRIGGVVLDVWENEPAVDKELAGAAEIATPHIAGYSLDGKYAGVGMLYKALCDFTGARAEVDVEALKPPPPAREVIVRPAANVTACLNQTVKNIYDIEEDDRRLRRTLQLPGPERAGKFDSLRKNYPDRREFFTATAKPGHSIKTELWEKIRQILRGLGFRLK